MKPENKLVILWAVKSEQLVNFYGQNIGRNLYSDRCLKCTYSHEWNYKKKNNQKKDPVTIWTGAFSLVTIQIRDELERSWYWLTFIRCKKLQQSILSKTLFVTSNYKAVKSLQTNLHVDCGCKAACFPEHLSFILVT